MLTVSLSLATFKILSLSLIFGRFNYDVFWCVPLWVHILWESLSFLDLSVYFLCQIRDFYFVIFSNMFSISCSSSSLSSIPMIWMLAHLKTSQSLLILSYCSLNSCFFIRFWLCVYFFLMFQLIDLNPGFLPFMVGFLWIFLYFT